MSLRGISLRQILIIGGLLVLVMLIMDFNNRMAELHRLSQQAGQVSLQATDMVQTQVYLETQIAYATSDQAVEEWARVQGHMARPGDRPVIPVAPEGQVQRPTPLPEPTPVPVQNWEVWVALFVDSGPGGLALP